METVYKIVTHACNRRRSVVSLAPSWRQDYPVGKKVQPNHEHSFLYACKTLNDAKRIVRAYKWAHHPAMRVIEIWEAEANTVRNKPKVGYPGVFKSHADFWELFNGRRKQHQSVGYFAADAPKGTIWCKSIKLIKLVKAYLET